MWAVCVSKRHEEKEKKENYVKLINEFLYVCIVNGL